MSKPKIKIVIELVDGELSRGDMQVTVKSVDQGRYVTRDTWLNSLTRQVAFVVEGSEEIVIGVGVPAGCTVSL